MHITSNVQAYGLVRTTSTIQCTDYSTPLRRLFVDYLARAVLRRLTCGVTFKVA